MNKPDLTTLDTEVRLGAEVAAYENDLIPATEGGEIAEFKQEDFALVSKAGDYLPRVQLFSSNSEACKQGIIPIAHYGIPRSDKVIDDLGTEVDVLVIHGRPKAMRIDKATGNILVKYDPKSDEFQKIAEESNLQDSGCMYGPEFLLYVPKVKEFATFFMSSKTARKSSAGVFQRMRKAGTLKAEFIKGKRHSWHGPYCVPCSAPMEVPDADTIAKMTKKFFDQKESKAETVDPAQAGGRER